MTNLQPAIEASPGRSALLLGILNDYLTLTKPPIVVLLLVTAAGGMFLASQGLPSLLLM